MEMHFEERLVGALLDRKFHFLNQQLQHFVVRVRLQQILIEDQPLLAKTLAVVLLDPGRSAIARMQNDALVSHRPSFFGRREMHVQDAAANRYLCLRPGLSLIVGENDVPTMARCEIAVAKASHGIQQGPRRKFAGHGRQVEHVVIRENRCMRGETDEQSQPDACL